MVTASVVLPCHDATRTLPLQLAALTGQEQAPDFEVLLIDNRSRDDLAALASRWQPRLPRLRVVPAHGRPGAAYARNVGISVATGSHLLFCDADDVIARDWVRRGHEALTQVAVATGGDLTLPDDAFGSVDEVWRGHLDRLPGGPIGRATGPTAYPILLGGNLAARRETLLDVGGFDAAKLSANEDNDLAVRLQQAGHWIHRAPAMRIAIRARSGLPAVFRRARAAGRGHVELCAQHDLWASSPYLASRRWRLDLARSAGAGARMLTRPAPQRDWPAVAERLGAAIGALEGDLAYRTRPGRTAVGAGLTGDRREDLR